VSTEFYLFDVDHGQSAALRLPHGEWCLFDIGCTGSFSPTKFIRQISGRGDAFRYYKATISHLHGDHVRDHVEFIKANPSFVRSVTVDKEHADHLKQTNTDNSFENVCAIGNYFNQNFGFTGVQANYGFATISELSLPVNIARLISSSANSSVNNASVVTRISCYGHSILICGDMEADGWDYVLNRSNDKAQWRTLVSNVDVLVAPHHGHSSGYSADLMKLANPGVVLISVKSGDEHVDSRYSSIPGIQIGYDEYKVISTRQKGTVKITVTPGQTLFSPNSIYWNFDADGRKADMKRIFESLIMPTFNNTNYGSGL
jgi:hypothetical protein